jgi:hypothetical protein
VPIVLTGNPTAGGTLNKTTISGNDGRYQVTDLPAGTYQIQAGTP